MSKGSRKIKSNGIIVSVQDWSPWRKLPVLVVEFEGENRAYKVASFNSEATARWFLEVMGEFFAIRPTQFSKEMPHEDQRRII